MILLGFQCLRQSTLKSPPFAGALSVCDDYCDHLPDTWCLDWTNPSRIPADFTPGEAAVITEECTTAFGKMWEWPDLMTDETWARAFHTRWAAPRGYQLVAIACAPQDRARLVVAMGPPPQQAGFAPQGALGLHIMAERTQSLDSHWPILGWEVLEANSATVGDCHTTPTVANEVTGLMPTYEAARSLAVELQARSACRAHIPIAICAVTQGAES